MAWYFDPAFWHNGYGIEVCKAVINHKFNDLLFIRFCVQIDVNNTSSRKLAERLNFNLNAILLQRKSLPIKNYFLTNWLVEHRTIRPIQIRQSGRISAPLAYGIFNTSF